MTYSMRLVHLDVGQGTGTFLEVYDDDSGMNELVHTALFDFGSDHDTKESGGPSVEYVVAKLKDMDQPTLSAVILSHSDSDHITLLTKLLKAFTPYDKDDPKNTQLRVLYSAHGGAEDDYKKAGFNVLVELKKYMKANTQKVDRASVAIPAEYSSFKFTDNAPLRKIGPVKVYVLVGNYPNGALGTTPTRNASGKLDAFSLNTVSMVCVLSYAYMQMIETGDATGATLKWANKILNDYDDMKDYINDVKGMTVPHHGSSVTMFDFGKAGGGAVTPEANLRNFLAWIKAVSYTVSASATNSHRHPNALLLKYFWDRVRDGHFYSDPVVDPYHYYTAYFKSESLEQVEVKGTKTIRKDWPPAWPDKIVMKKPKVVPKKKTSKTAPKKVATPVPVEEDRLTVRMQRPVYSSAYYDGDASAWEFIGYPPNPVQELTPLPATTKIPPRGVAWVYSTTFSDDDHASTVLLRETNRKTLIELRRALDAGVAPEDLPRVPREDLPPYRTESDGDQSPDRNQDSMSSSSTAPVTAAATPAPAAAPLTTVTVAAARPRPRAGLEPGGPAAVPAPGSRMRRLEVIR